MSRRPGLVLPVLVLATAYLGVVTAPFLAPYPPDRQFREYSYSAPSLTWIDAGGELHLWPGVARTDSDSEWRPIRLFARGEAYRWGGLTWERHLFGLSDPQSPVFLLGADSLGRDLFSRLVHGARFSLTIGLAGIVVAVGIGLGLGVLAGYAGGWTDAAVMRLSDLFLSLPALLLVLGIRAVFPLDLAGGGLYWLIVFIFALISWSSIARVIRGQVLSLKTRGYVMAAIAAGASDWRIITRHILPFTSSFLLVQASVLVPAFILGEITLSFLGVGVQEPAVSWGSLLASANSIAVIGQYPWLATPAVAIFVTVFAFNLLGDQLKALGRVRTQWW